MIDFLVVLFVLVVIVLIIRNEGKLTNHSHWNTLIPVQFSAQEYFTIIQDKLKASGVESIKFDTLNLREKVVSLNSRTYLKITYQDFVFYVCGSPFGQHFFVSYWGHFKTSQGENVLRSIPFIGNFLANKLYAITYYQYDQCSAFMTLIHTHITETIEELATQQGVKLPEIPKPVMSDVFKR